MVPTSIQTQCSSGQGRMTGASSTVYEFNSILEANTFVKAFGFHSLTKLSKYIMQEDNEHDEYIVNDRL